MSSHRKLLRRPRIANQATLFPVDPTEISVLVQFFWRHQRYHLRDVSRQQNCPTDSVFRTNQSLTGTSFNRPLDPPRLFPHTPTQTHGRTQPQHNDTPSNVTSLCRIGCGVLHSIWEGPFVTVGGPIGTSPPFFIVSNHAVFTMLLVATYQLNLPVGDFSTIS